MGKKKINNRISAKPWISMTENGNYCYHSVHRKIGKKSFCLICNSMLDKIVEHGVFQSTPSNKEEKSKEYNQKSLENT